ncbi:PKD domain-containing protein [Flavobacterium faecale]|nr:PKD domain-containing protein [Flavobacterium faecale]
MKTNTSIIKRIAKFSNSALAIMTCFLIASCNPTIDSLAFELPEANSKADLNPPIAKFAATETADYLTYTFSNTSTSATNYTWDYGDGKTSITKDGENTFPAEGTYTVTLTAKDKLDKTSVFSTTVTVVKPIVPPSIIPDILNGDFNDGQDNWKFSSFSGGTTSPYNTSGDGSWLNYDESDNGSKTAGAKWTKSTSAGVYVSSKTQYAYQAIDITPNTNYILEFEYAIKTEAEQDGVAPGGNRIIGEILNGQFSDGADAIASSTAGPLAQHNGTIVLGKTTFTKVTKVFTSNATGKVSILIYGVTDVDAYVDNVKVYPAK